MSTVNDWDIWIRQCIEFPAYPWHSWWENIVILCRFSGGE